MAVEEAVVNGVRAPIRIHPDQALYSIASYYRDVTFDLTDKMYYKLELIIASTTTCSRRLQATSEDLSKRWAVGKQVASDTVKATTQAFIRSAVHPIEHRFKTKNATLRYNHLRSTFYSDTMFSNTRSVLGNSMAQLFTNDQGFIKVVPMSHKSDAGHALSELIQDVGIPYHMHTDKAKELILGTWKKVCREHGIRMSNTEPHAPQQNRAEGAIQELKRHTSRFMSRTNTPQRLWDFAAVYTAELRNRLALPLYQLHGRTPIDALTGNTPDISEYLDFEWYQPIWIYDSAPFPEQRRNIGRWLGIAHRVGQAMCYWVLPPSGVPIARTTIQAISKDELKTDVISGQLQAYDAEMAIKLGPKLSNDTTSFALNLRLYREDEDNENDDDIEPFEPEACTPNIDAFEADQYDELLLAEPSLPRNNTLLPARVIGRKRDQDGNPVGHYNSNPLLNTRVYLAEFEDGRVAEYGGNMIAEAIYNQIDGEGFDEVLFNEVIGHRKNDDALPAEALDADAAPRRTTKGWDICIEWKDGSSSWHPLCEIKNSFPIHLAEYAM